MSGRDLCFVVGGPFGLELDGADHRLSLGPMTLPHQLARVVLLEQLFRAHKILEERALPPLMARPAATSPPSCAACGRCCSCSRPSSRSARSGSSLTEDVGVWRGFIWTLDILATVGSIPAPGDRRRADRQGRPDRPRRGYALLRPRDGDGVLRLRATWPTCCKSAAPRSSSTPPATTTSSAASAASAARSPATCAPRAPATSSSTTTRRCASTRRASACASSRASRPTTRSCARPASMRARGGHRLRRLRRREHLHHAHRRAACAPTSRSSRARREEAVRGQAPARRRRRA